MTGDFSSQTVCTARLKARAGLRLGSGSKLYSNMLPGPCDEDATLLMQPAAKHCALCGQLRNRRYFKACKPAVDGLMRICDGCKHRMDTFRRLVVFKGLDEQL